MARSVVKCLSVMVVRSCCLLNAAHSTFSHSCLDLVPFDVTVSSNLLRCQGIERESITDYFSLH